MVCCPPHDLFALLQKIGCHFNIMITFLIMDQNFEINCRSSYISYINKHLEKKC